MIGRLRRIPFVIALVCAVLVVLVELGSGLFLKGEPGTAADIIKVYPEAADEFDEGVELGEEEAPPGLAIAYMALVDGQWVFVLGLVGLALLIPERFHGRVQGLVTLIFAILLLLGGILLAIVSFVLLLLMVALFLAAPFGTIAYLAKWGFFNTGGAAGTLSTIMLLKLAAVVLLVIAHQRFLQNKGLVLLTLTSLLCNIIIAFLHGLVPIILVSITDALGALVIAIIGIIWALVLAICGLISVIKAIV
jgi:hypothetical protein